MIRAAILLLCLGCASCAEGHSRGSQQGKINILPLVFAHYGQYVGEDGIAWYYLSRTERRLVSGSAFPAVYRTTYTYVGVYVLAPHGTFTLTTDRPLEFD